MVDDYCNLTTFVVENVKIRIFQNLSRDDFAPLENSDRPPFCVSMRFQNQLSCLSNPIFSSLVT